ncbi:hypothetical protein X551_03436 [Methylibium sp. T29]|nr:hypothetical protein X551_03436 [Methylibium sp. T29]EWS58222.1 hypothetical protein Y694_03880 [Methylibium sp. T29-B]
MPCAASPAAKPRAAQSRTLSALSSGVTISAPTMPVVTANTAASVAEPPMRSAMPIAIGAVTDFGSNEARINFDPPSAQAVPSATVIEVAAPSNSASSKVPARARSSGHRRANGTASATVAVPSRKCTNCAPSK